MDVNYDHRIFRGRTNSDNGEVGGQTTFHYRQSEDRVWATYSGGDIVSGHLQGKVCADGNLEFVYHHENVDGELMAGQCFSTPSQDTADCLVLKEHWQWLTGDRTSGYSEVEEITGHA
ncbi:n-acetylglutamate synthase [Marinobacter sp. NFXS9]|uniref:n-acetylglutamate synthase n=1 Tax=Marinobacter sp. NFXS9 TaxID=2818433 RepID=UPI0032DFA19D